MAVIRWERQDALGDQLRQLGRPVIRRIVEAGADAAVDHMRERINEMHRRTGDMAGGVAKSKYIETIDGGRDEVYPQGEDRHGERNATKAYVINYGRGGTRKKGRMRDHFIDRDPYVDDIVGAAMDRESDRIIAEINGR